MNPTATKVVVVAGVFLLTFALFSGWIPARVAFAGFYATSFAFMAWMWMR